MTDQQDSFSTAMYLRAKAIWRGLRPRSLRGGKAPRDTPESSLPFGRDRDPMRLTDVLDLSSREMGWSIELSQARLFEEWAQFVGETIAPHTRLLGLRDGVLVAECDSTSWATELRRLRGEILTRILAEYPDSGITELKFLAPGAPSWRHGPRRVQGRGPRDTYG